VPQTYECPVRWADMDMLGHVNNVTYLDYVAEARENLFPDSSVGRAPVRRHQVAFVAPLVFRRRPVLVDSWVTEVGDGSLTLAHEVYDPPKAPEEGRTVYARVSTVLDASLTPRELDRARELTAPAPEWRDIAAKDQPGGDVYDLTVRRADVDESGLVRDVAFFEYFQEARIKFLMNLHTRGQRWNHHVVAQTDLDYLRPVPHRQEPYAVRSWVGHVGTRSFTIRAEVLDGKAVVARAGVVMVIFDQETQRPTDMPESQRERLLQELHAAGQPPERS
jgi:acyl-CoA thioester hydrolase